MIKWGELVVIVTAYSTTCGDLAAEGGLNVKDSAFRYFVCNQFSLEEGMSLMYPNSLLNLAHNVLEMGYIDRDIHFKVWWWENIMLFWDGFFCISQEKGIESEFGL